MTQQTFWRQVRDLHRPVDDRTGWVAVGEYGTVSPACSECGSDDQAVRWPCRTIRALDDTEA